MSLIRLTVTPDELESVHRFLYEVLVETLGRKQQAADHRSRTICDQLDDTSRIFAARDDIGRIFGTVRVNFA